MTDMNDPMFDFMGLEGRVIDNLSHGSNSTAAATVANAAVTYTDLMKLSQDLNKALAVPKHLVLPRSINKSHTMAAMYGGLAWRSNSGDDQMDTFRYNIHGSLTGRFESRMKAHIDDLWKNKPKFKSRRFKTIMHAFHHKQGYIEIQNASLKDAPNHSYVLWQGHWYKKVRAKQIDKIKPKQVPSAHRLHLMIMHIDQPKG